MRDSFFFFFLFPLLFASINIIPTLCILFIGIKSPVPLYHLYSLIPVVLFPLYIYLSRFIACSTTKDNLFTTCLNNVNSVLHIKPVYYITSAYLDVSSKFLILMCIVWNSDTGVTHGVADDLNIFLVNPDNEGFIIIY